MPVIRQDERPPKVETFRFADVYRSTLADCAMSAKNFSLLAAVIFAIVAILQLARALSGAPITIDTTFSVPVWAS